MGDRSGKPVRVPRQGSARLRILGWFAILIIAAGAVSLFLQQRILLAQLDEAVESALTQETEELRVLVGGTDPETGQPFNGDVEAIFRTFLRRNIPDDGESLLTFVDGEHFRSIRGPVDLSQDPGLVRRWATLTTSQRGEITTDAGQVRFLATPVLDGEEPRGVFVVANFLRGEREEISRATGVGSAVLGTVVLVALGVAWATAGRVLAPVRTMTDAARELTETDLSQRITVPDTDDEVAYLALTFNEMLSRLDTAFAEQSHFLKDVGHELRTPITIIRGHLELATTDAADFATTRALVLDELDRMSRLVGELVLMARSEAPDFVQLAPVDLDLLTAEILDKARGLADRTFELVATGHGIVHADRQRLIQAVMNLLENAVRHTEPGTTIELGSALDGGRAQIWVRDHGPGIPEAEQERIFERLAQNGERSGSAGLGLTIVRAIALGHRGSVTVDSSPGQGATFTITISAGPQEFPALKE